MNYSKTVFIDDVEFVFSLEENKELIFYTYDKTNNPFDQFGTINKQFNNLHGKTNVFKLIIELEKYIKYLFSCGVTYFYFSCERERVSIYNRFIDKIVKDSQYRFDCDKNTFYVYKCL